MTILTANKPQFLVHDRGEAELEWQPYWDGLERAVLAQEGAGAPYELINREFLSVWLSPTWGMTPRGMALWTDTVAQETYYWGTSPWVPAKNVTVLLHKLKDDATARASSGFGVRSTTAAHLCGSHTPYSDGTVYWDFGGNSGNNRLTYAGGSFGDDIWMFRAGDSGSQIWQNGILRASHANAITRTVEATNQFHIGNGNAGGLLNADLAKYAIFVFWTRELTDAQIIKISRTPWGPFTRREERVFKVPTVVAGWTGEIIGVTNPSEILGIAVANIDEVIAV